MSQEKQVSNMNLEHFVELTSYIQKGVESGTSLFKRSWLILVWAWPLYLRKS